MAPMVTAHYPDWDPIEVLGLQVGNSIRCHGSRKDGQGCCNPIGKSWHPSLHSTRQHLQQMAPSEITQQDLELLASWLLCARYHRGQQDSILACQWYSDLGYFIKNGRSRHAIGAHIRDEQVAAAQAATQSALQSNVKLLAELQEAQRRLMEAEAMTKQLKASNKSLRSSNKVLELQHETDQQCLRDTESRLLDECKQYRNDMRIAQQQHESAEKLNIQKYQDLEEALGAKNRQLEGVMEDSQRHHQLAVSKERKLNEETKNLKIKDYLRTFKNHVRIGICQRERDALRADNETLRQQQKCLQQVATGFRAEMEALQVGNQKLRFPVLCANNE